MNFEANSLGGSFKISSEEGEGLRPKALMLDALAGCTGLDVASLIAKMRLNVEKFEIEVDGELTDEHPKFYHKVIVKYLFEGHDLNKEKLQHAVDLSVEKYCGVLEMFRKFATVKIEVAFHEI